MTTETIYVQLLDEGVPCWRPVQALNEGEGRYRIVTSSPDADVERWSFAPGDLVRCERRRLSEEEVLVAVAHVTGASMEEVATGVLELTPAQIEQFITDGFVRIDRAFAREHADAARAILWKATGCDPDDPATWTQPVIRLGMFTQPPFVAAANTPRLHAAFDQLVGQGRWRRPAAIGTFPVRFPSAVDPGDAGWHIDVSFGTDTADFMSWRANVHSKGRALLMLFLFSDVGGHDAPTRIRVGSHADIARQLAPAGEEGLTLRELAADGFAASAHCPIVTATGDAGTVYLCHPFLVHAAQPHQGSRPRFLAQPPLLPAEPDTRRHGELNAVEQATARALARVLDNN